MNQTANSQTPIFRLRHMITALLALALFLTGGLNIAWAQDVSKPVIAILDRDQVFLNSKVGKNAVATVRKRAQDYEKQVYAERDKLKAEEAKLKQQKTVLAKEEFQRRVRELRLKAQNLQLKVSGMRARLNRAMQAAKGKLLFEIVRTLPDIQKRRKFTVVLDRRNVLVFDERLNITKEVIAALDKRITTINLDAPPPRKKTN